MCAVRTALRYLRTPRRLSELLVPLFGDQLPGLWRHEPDRRMDFHGTRACTTLVQFCSEDYRVIKGSRTPPIYSVRLNSGTASASVMSANNDK